jgi:hypothetical protein
MPPNVAAANVDSAYTVEKKMEAGEIQNRSADVRASRASCSTHSPSRWRQHAATTKVLLESSTPARMCNSVSQSGGSMWANRAASQRMSSGNMGKKAWLYSCSAHPLAVTERKWALSQRVNALVSAGDSRHSGGKSTRSAPSGEWSGNT